MKSQRIILLILVALTFLTAIISQESGIGISLAILGLAVLKFIGVSFWFMELKNGHIFWKGSVLVFLLIFMGVVIIML